MNNNIKLPNDWKELLCSEFSKSYMISLRNFLVFEKKKNIVYTKGKDIFKSFFLTSFNNVKVVFIGQDPYCGFNQADGLCFSVSKNMAIPPSLLNIYKELERDLGIKKYIGNLDNWAKQGILLLNSVLTVRHGKPGSHFNYGWEIFTDKVIQIISKKKKNVIFLLFGYYSKKKIIFINRKDHIIIKTSHPSPLSFHNGFKNSKIFSRINNYLYNFHNYVIKWNK